MRPILIALILLSSACSYEGLPPDYDAALRELETESLRDATEAREAAALVASYRSACPASDNGTDCREANSYAAAALNVSAEILTSNARLACAIRYHADQSGSGFAGFAAGVLDWFGLPTGWLLDPLDARMQAGQCL